MLQYDFTKYQITRSGITSELTGHQMFQETQKKVSTRLGELIWEFTGQAEFIPGVPTEKLQKCLPPKGYAQTFHNWLFEVYLTVDTYMTDEWVMNCQKAATLQAKEAFRKQIEREIKKRGRAGA